MSFVWRDFYELARWLQDNKNIQLEEATLRTICNRSYYAAFEHMVEKAEAIGYTPSDSVADHSGLRRFLKGTKYKRHAPVLQNLYYWRELADYHKEVSNLERLANGSIVQAKFILDNS